MADISTNLQALINTRSDLETGVASFGYSVTSGSGYEELSSKVTDISTDINNGLISTLGGTFYASIVATSLAGSVVNATLSGNTTSHSVASGETTTTLYVATSGTYSVNATMSNGGGNPKGVSNTQSVSVTTKGSSYNTSLSFATITITSCNVTGANITLSDGTNTIDGGTWNGTNKVFYLPSTGTWTITATKDNQTGTTTVSASSYTNYNTTITLS